MEFDTVAASDYSIADLAEFLNRGFENYFVPIGFNTTSFLNMVRKDGLDLTISRVLLGNGEPIGIALLARRGWSSRLAAMGIASESRGLGAGSWFMGQLIAEAGERGEREMLLEVIEQNEPAIHLYENCGFQIMRRLIGLVRADAIEDGMRDLEEVDIHAASQLISQYAVSDLPWQLSTETISQMNPPARAYCSGSAYIVLSNPELNDVAVWSLIVETSARGNGLGTEMLKAVMAAHPNKTWRVPALLPEELGKVFERAGFVREELSQWQMRHKI
jgi:ribosomal protein S18 acetylase RimI-like enzyme